MRGERSPQASNASTNGAPVADVSATKIAATERPQLITKENDGAESIEMTLANGHHHHKKIAATEPISTPATILNTKANAHNTEQFVDTIPINRNQCDTNVNNTELRLNTGVDSDGGDGSSVRTASVPAMASATVLAASSNNLSGIINGDSPQNGINNNNNDRHLSKKIRERIDSETRLIEDKLVSSFDKTVTGIVELKDDLMRVNQNEIYAPAGMKLMNNDEGLRKRNLTEMTNGKEIETFLRKEMNNANVKVVLGNSQAD